MYISYVYCSYCICNLRELKLFFQGAHAQLSHCIFSTRSPKS